MGSAQMAKNENGVKPDIFKITVICNNDTTPCFFVVPLPLMQLATSLTVDATADDLNPSVRSGHQSPVSKPSSTR